MAYDLHIKRTDELNPISIEEWISYVRSDPELKLEERAETVSPEGTVLSISADGLARWTSHPLYCSGRVNCWFDFRRGKISSANPDEVTVNKMRQIAEGLGAEVVGDEGERY